MLFGTSLYNSICCRILEFIKLHWSRLWFTNHTRPGSGSESGLLSKALLLFLFCLAVLTTNNKINLSEIRTKHFFLSEQSIRDSTFQRLLNHKRIQFNEMTSVLQHSHAGVRLMSHSFSAFSDGLTICATQLSFVWGTLFDAMLLLI